MFLSSASVKMEPAECDENISQAKVISTFQDENGVTQFDQANNMLFIVEQDGNCVIYLFGILYFRTLALLCRESIVNIITFIYFRRSKGHGTRKRNCSLT